MAAKPKSALQKSTDRQIVAAVKSLHETAKDENISLAPLFLPPITPEIYTGELTEKYAVKYDNPAVLNPLIGEVDIPHEQRQRELTLPISEKGNAIIYGATGSGKTTYLTTMLHSLISNYTADWLNAYIIDFGAGTLQEFTGAPQIGDFAGMQDTEKLTNMFKMLSEELEHRRKLFTKFGGDYNSYCKNSGQHLPNILVVLNNYTPFWEEFEHLHDEFTLLTRDGIKYGIYFAVTAATANAITYRVQQNFGQIVTLRLNDESDYSYLVGKTGGLLPSNLAGRGLCALDGIDAEFGVFEFQTARAIKDADEFEAITALCDKLHAESKVFAPKVPVLPDNLTAQMLLTALTEKGKQVKLKDVPVGINKADLQTVSVDLQSAYIYPVCSENSYLLERFAPELVSILQHTDAKLSALDGDDLLGGISGIDIVSDGFESKIEGMFNEVVTRNNTYKDAKLDKKSLDAFEQKIIILTGVERILATLSDDGKEKLKLLLEKGEAIYKMHFILLDAPYNLGNSKFDAWFKKHITGTNGLWLGDGMRRQSPEVISTDKFPYSASDEIGNSFAFLVRNSQPKLVMEVQQDKEAGDE